MENRDFLNFCENVRVLRATHQLTQKQMAKELRIGVDSLRAIERGRIPARLSCDIIFRIFERFGILPKDQFSPPKE